MKYGWNSDMTSARTRSFVMTLAATAILLAAAISCRKTAKEEVQPPQKSREERVQQQKQPEPNEEPAQKPEQTKQAKQVEKPVQQVEGTQVQEQGLAHGPERKCELCHGKRDQEQIASAEVKLVAKLAKLCLRCHPEADYSTSKEVVHGPLAVAECLFCHDPHLSKNEHLLKKLPPELCCGCHEKEAVEAIPDHSGATGCLSCHTGHSSPKKGLLKKTYIGPNSG